MLESCIQDTTELYCHREAPKDTWNVKAIYEDLVGIIALEDEAHISEHLSEYDTDGIAAYFTEKALERYAAREREFGSELTREIERVMLLRAVDENWMTHIDAIDQLKHGVGLQAYGHHDPLVEYKFQSFEMFEEMNKTIRQEALRLVFTVQIRKGQNVERKKVAGDGEARLAGAEDEGRGKTSIKKKTKVGRNDPCPCGSGKKYKNCCGQNE